MSYLKINFISILILLFSSAHIEADIETQDDVDIQEGANWRELLGPPPEVGSNEEHDEFLYLMNLQDTRSEQDCKLAASEEDVTLKAFFGSVLSKFEMVKFQASWLKYLVKVGLPTHEAKKYFSRVRPFNRYTQIDPCIKKPSGDTSYPSGHTSLSRVMAYVLALEEPDRAEQFFKRAKVVAFNRMLGGVHFPSDVRKGQVLADYLAKKYFAHDKNFKRILKYAQMYAYDSLDL